MREPTNVSCAAAWPTNRPKHNETRSPATCPPPGGVVVDTAARLWLSRYNQPRSDVCHESGRSMRAISGQHCYLVGSEKQCVPNTFWATFPNTATQFF